MLNFTYSSQYDKAINGAYSELRRKQAYKAIEYLELHRNLLEDSFTSMCNLLYWDPPDELNIFIMPSWKSNYTGISNPLTVTLTQKSKKLLLIQVLTNILHELAHIAQKHLHKTDVYKKFHKNPVIATHILTFSLMLEVIPVNLHQYMKSENADYKLAREIAIKKGPRNIINLASKQANLQ